ncbi:MAG TPA: TolC family protein [Vicinamibacterales bacterium]|nr:TolC family protein [Vicinamibacterales bacterium]
MLRSFTRVAGTCVIACAAAYAWAAEAVHTQADLTLADALRAANAHNPALRGAPVELRALEGRRQQAAARPNPELELEFENFGGGGDFAGTDALETTLALSQLIELGGKRDARIAFASREYDLLRADQEVRRLDVQAEVARRFLDVVAQQERVALAHDTAELASEVHAGVQKRVDAARSPIAEESRADIARIRAALVVTDAERDLESARYALAATWGAHRPNFQAARADLQDFPEVAEFDALVSQLEQKPDQLRFLSEQRLREAELRLARATRKPDFTVGAGVRRFEETGDNAFVLSLSVPLPVANRNAGAIAESQARIEALPYEREAALLEVRTRLFRLYQELQQARTESTALDSQLVPQAREALEQTRAGFDRGRFSYLEVAEAQRELLELELTRIETAAAFHLLLIEIERLTRQSLATSTS